MKSDVEQRAGYLFWGKLNQKMLSQIFYKTRQSQTFPDQQCCGFAANIFDLMSKQSMRTFDGVLKVLFELQKFHQGPSEIYQCKIHELSVQNVSSIPILASCLQKRLLTKQNSLKNKK